MPDLETWWSLLYDPARMLLARSGDIHPRPRPLIVESVNVTSLRQHWRQVLRSKADMLCLQETRLTTAGQRAMTTLAKKLGWRALWGTPLPPKGDGMWDTGPGGVGILYTPGMVVQQAARPPQDEKMLALWESGRWLHVHLAHGEGRSILNVQVVYGIVGQRCNNAQLWKAVILHTA